MERAVGRALRSSSPSKGPWRVTGEPGVGQSGFGGLDLVVDAGVCVFLTSKSKAHHGFGMV